MSEIQTLFADMQCANARLRKYSDFHVWDKVEVNYTASIKNPVQDYTALQGLYKRGVGEKI